MSVRVSLSQKSRPYKIDVYGLQDNYIGTLQSFNDSFIGQIVEPEIVISDDGTQTFTCSIPKFYIDPETNLKFENPRWADVNTGVLAENTRILKVFLKDKEENKVYPFIVDKIIDKRDSHFSIYKEITCNGLAFAELGKTGYKLELTKEIVELELEKNPELLPTMDYWLDKVFPNEKDADGKIIKWLTPWCYEIRMDWSHHSATDRFSSKMYEDSYVSSWGIDTTYDGNGNITSEKLVSREFKAGQEKARFIDCKASNRYNITQNIAEAFEVFCQYEYKCDIRGRFVREYFEEIKDENDVVLYTKVWTGRKVIFYNRAIKTDNPAIIEYRKNLDTIQRIKESSELYTKLYITPIESSTMDTGYISIADTALNPTLDDFILNFDYLYSTGAISQYQMNFVKTYEVETHKLNQKLINLAPHIEDLTVQINDLKAKRSLTEGEKSSAQTSLDQYQTLRDSEVINEPVHKFKDNPFSVIFVEDGDIKKAAFRLIGIDMYKNTIKGYSNYTYTTEIFNSNDIIIVEQINPVMSGDTNYYIVVDEYGYPEYIYTSKDNPDFEKDNSSIIYLDLWYCPKNAYEDICEQLKWRISNKEISYNALTETINNLQKELDDYKLQQDGFLKDKEYLNQKLEVVLGPALREGYWTPDSYEDPEESKIIEDIPRVDEGSVIFTFDTELFDGESKNYYYASVENEDQDIKSYYDYLDISDIYQDWKNNEINNLTIHLKNPYSKYVSTSALKPGSKCYIIYNGINYYYQFKTSIAKGDELILSIAESGLPQISVNGGEPLIGSIEILSGATNWTDRFQGTINYLGERLLYNNAGFIFSFFKNEQKELKPVLLLNNSEIPYKFYKTITYSFSAQKTGVIRDLDKGIDCFCDGSAENTICYPRIIIKDANVNYKSDNLKIIPYEEIFTEESQALENYVDYSILIRDGRPHFNLKITNLNNLVTILAYKYRIEYRVSRANEMLYLDAKNVARDNSQPKYSYELKISNTPESTDFYELGQLVYINDFSVGIHAASGYVSEIKLKLNSPKDDELKIKNYKTKFEDLFSTITASSEAMRNNQHAYDIAAGSFNSDGTIAGSVLQNSILNNNISMNYSNTNVEIDDTNGIVLTNSQPYLNGVYGQVKLIGGGIFLSNAIDASGARVWNTGITPNGINAALINAGQLDVEKIRIFAGNNVAFQWNGEGIFAYKQTETGVDLNTFVKYSDKGLQFVSGDHTAVDLGWNGLLISTQDGSTELSGDLGLTVYHGQKNEAGNNYAVRLGKFNEDNEYGLRLYKKEGEEYIPTLITSNNGELWLRDYISIGLENWTEDGVIHAAGISGNIDNTEAPLESVRFWAGSSYLLRKYAPFRVLQDGTLWATQANIEGNITATNIIANKGQIGGWDISESSLSSDGIILQAKSGEDQHAAIIVGDSSQGNFVTITSDGTLTANGAVINGTINASGGTIGNLTVEDLSKINANLKSESVEITSSRGYITKTGEEFNTTFTAIIKKGGIEISEEEYVNYSFNWLCRDSEEEDWRRLPDSETSSRFVSYSEIHFSQRQVKCEVTNLKGE